VENVAGSLAQERLPADPAGNEGDDRRDSRGRPHPAEVAEQWEREAAAAPDGADGIGPFSSDADRTSRGPVARDEADAHRASLSSAIALLDGTNR
jgi:hypothetical protein